MMTYDVAIIGSGPGGYVAAIKAAQQGLKVACIDKRKRAGGTCLNVGCIPSKTMLHATEVSVLKAKEANNWHKEKKALTTPCLDAITKTREQTIQGLGAGIAFLFKKNKIDPFLGYTASFASETKLQLKSEGKDGKDIEAKNIIIATGSVPASLPNITIDEESILSSTGALALKTIPKSMVVIGGGVIGLEMATIFTRLGSKVTVLEFLPTVGGPLDKQVAVALRKILEKQGIKIITGMAVSGVSKAGSGGELTVTASALATKKDQTFAAEKILVAVGRRPFTGELNLAKVGIETDKIGRIPIDEHFKTVVPNIYAIGDCVAGPMLAHKAEEDAASAVENIKGGKETNEFYAHTPGVVYTHPECASIGLTEEQLKEKKVAYKAVTFPMAANSRSKCNGTSDGLVKVIVDKTSNKILGASILSEAAGEMIGIFTLAMKYGLTAKQIGSTISPHPSISEAVKEACMAASGSAIHM